MRGAPTGEGTTVVVGLGLTGRAVARALVRRGGAVVLVDDAPGPEARALAAELDQELLVAPGPDRLREVVAGAAAVVPAPGLRETHPVVGLAAEAGVPLVGELDLAAAWDERPTVAITGTDGKTTVTTLVREMLVASGIAAVEAGNTDVPLVEAIDDPEPDVFVVEASSFRLAPLRRFAPRAGCWLNFGPDHQDVHRDLAAYEAAKANIWRGFGADQLAVANRDDPVVLRHATGLPRLETFGLGPAPDDGGRHWIVRSGVLRTPEGDALLRVDALPRALPHDLANALAAAATARAVGARPDGTAAALRSFRGLPHRVQRVGERDGVTWYDDSKATAPHATLAALAGMASAVLIAGGRNKGLDLSVLGEAAPRLRGVVAIGEAADEVGAAFAGRTQVVRAGSMDEAVAVAARLARPGDAVVLSPACASFDQYEGYAARGDDFVRAATALGVRPVDEHTAHAAPSDHPPGDGPAAGRSGDDPPAGDHPVDRPPDPARPTHPEASR